MVCESTPFMEFFLLSERVGIQEWFTGEVNPGTVAAEAVGSIRGTRIPYRASGVPYRFTQ